MNNPDSLKKQFIDAMSDRLGEKLAESLFEHDLWPVLKASMAAGELLVARNTVPQKPVHEAIKIWLEGCVAVVGRMRSNEATVSKAEALKTLYQLALSADQALKDASLIGE